MTACCQSSIYLVGAHNPTTRRHRHANHTTRPTPQTTPQTTPPRFLQEYFQNLLNSFTSLIKSSGAAAKVFEFIDRTPCYHNEEPRFAVAPADAPADAPEDVALSTQNIYEDAAPLPDALLRDSTFFLVPFFGPFFFSSSR